MLLRPVLVTAALAALAAPSAAFAAPTLQPLKRCYVAAQPEQREPVLISGSGFTPLATIDIYVDEIFQQPPPNTATPMATYAGEVTGSVSAPFIDSGQREFSLRLTERDTPQNSISATAKVTRLAVEQSPAKASTHDRVRFRGSGFTSLAPVYAHYVFAGKSRRTVRIGTPTGACGLFSVKRRQFPFKTSPRVGVWTIQFDQEVAYNPKAMIRVPLTVKVRKTIKP
jgi:hypothetical protein